MDNADSTVERPGAYVVSPKAKRELQDMASTGECLIDRAELWLIALVHEVVSVHRPVSGCGSHPQHSQPGAATRIGRRRSSIFGVLRWSAIPPKLYRKMLMIWQVEDLVDSA